MPNLCESVLILRGQQQDIDAFMAFAQTSEEPLAPGNFVPMPQEIAETMHSKPQEETAAILTAVHGASSWYDWSINNWGTKWGPQETVVERSDPNTLVYIFWTPWDPMGNNLLTAMSARFPTLNIKLEYVEPSHAYQGHATAEAGVLLESETTQIDHDDEDGDEC